MNTAQYNHLFSFIWNIANDVLVHAFEKGEYKKIIMPMMVLRRLDILLEPTKEKVLEKKAVMDKAGIANQEPVMFGITGYPFCNTSRFTMKKLTTMAAIGSRTVHLPPSRMAPPIPRAVPMEERASLR